jgi:hypothetical protein
MPIRNLWSLEPGECVAADELVKKLRQEVFFPLHDVGVDLLLVKGDKHVGIQVKESRYYHSRTWKKSGHLGHSWHRIEMEKFQRGKGKVQFYIFLTYVPLGGEHKEVSHFENKFLIVPSAELEKRMAIKSPGKNKPIYQFCFHFEDKNVWDERITVPIGNPLANYSIFLNAWNLIRELLDKD